MGLVDSPGVAHECEDIVEEEGEFLGIEGAASISVILGKNLVDVLFEGVVRYAHNVKIDENSDINGDKLEYLFVI